MATASRNQRSWVTTSRPPLLRAQRCPRCAASQAMPSTSRWFVGSSSATTSHSPTSSAASATRRRCPPLRVPMRASQDRSGTRPASTSRILASRAHSCSGRVPTTAARTVAEGSSASAWSSTPMRTPLRLVTRPESGVRRPDSSPRRLDLPSPLRPTMPIRSPSLTPSVTESKTTRVGYCRWMESEPINWATAPSVGRARDVICLTFAGASVGIERIMTTRTSRGSHLRRH